MDTQQIASPALVPGHLAKEDRTRLLTVAIKDITASPDNTRLFDKRDKSDKIALEELAASMQEGGLQQYPKVRPSGDIPPWTLVYGERRLRAARDILKWTDITVIVDDGLDVESAAAATVIENIQRRDLHPLDEARGLAVLRGQGQTIKDIARRLGRREDWVKERLKLCELPAKAQDIYRRSERMTLQQALGLHEHMHGGRDNAGFPDLVIALAEGLDTGQVTAMSGTPSLASIAAARPDLVVSVQHAHTDGEGRWGGNYFNSRRTCTKCPLSAYRPGYYEGVGYCLLPSHYADLKTKGQATYEAARTKAKESGESTGSLPPSLNSEPTKTPAQKGRETKQRHRTQRANYMPQVAAIERAIDMIPAVDGVDVAVLCAYTLTTRHVDGEAIRQVVKRHTLKDFPGTEPRPTKAQIERLRQLAPVEAVRYTLEALLLTQARRARDYDPGKELPDPVLALYLPNHVADVKEVAA